MRRDIGIDLGHTFLDFPSERWMIETDYRVPLTFIASDEDGRQIVGADAVERREPVPYPVGKIVEPAG